MVHIMLCDDEPQACARLREYLNKFAMRNSVSFDICETHSAEELLESCVVGIDILLLDIRMGRTNGMKAAQQLRVRCPDICIIFITSQVQFALEGYSVHAFGFLKKPVQYGLFEQLMSDALAMLNSHTSVSVEFISRGISYRIRSEDIYYAEAQGHTVTITHTGGKTIFSESLERLEELLETHCFFRCHKSYLINLRRVRMVTQTEIIMVNGDHIPLSRHRKSQFAEAFAAITGV